MKAHIANDDLINYKLPFLARVSEAFSNGWSVLQEFVVFVISIWALLLLVLAGVVTFTYLKSAVI